MRHFAQIISLLTFVALAGVLLADPGDSVSGDSVSGDSVSGDSVSGEGAASTTSAQAVPKAGAKAKNKLPLAITPEREAAVLNFVERNHAELSELLAHLKTSQPKQYEQAIKEIYRVTERLAGVQERDPLHYELEVKLWTAQSRVQLLAARLKMGDSESLKKELREALASQIDARLDVLKHQKQQAADRLAKMESDIGQLEANKEKAIERQLEMLARGAGSKNLTKAPAGKPGRRAAERATEKKAVE